MTLDPKTTAVLLIEYQNDFASEGGSLHEAVAPVMEANATIKNSVRLVEGARELGALIVHAPISFAEGHGEIAHTAYGILKGVHDSSSFERDSWGVKIIDELAPHAADVVLEGKRGLDTFASTSLDFILRSRGIDTLVIAGFLTNCCIESTMRSAYENGYTVVSAVDCMAATSQAEHDNAVSCNFPMFSMPTTTDDVLARLAGADVAVVAA